MKQLRSKKLPALALALLLAATLLAPCAQAEETGTQGGITITGSDYAGTDYIQFAVASTLGETEQMYFDLTCTAAGGAVTTLAQKVGCEAGPLGFDAALRGTYELTVYTMSGANRANLAHGRSVEILHQLGGTDTVLAAYSTVGETETRTYTARSTYYDAASGTDYDLAAGAAETAQLAYGVPSVTFQYVGHTQPTLYGSVSFVDTKGNILQQDTFPVLPENDAAHPTLYPAAGQAFPDTLEKNGVTYKKATAMQRVAASYTGKLDYTILYKEQTQSGAYTANIRYVDENGALLMTDKVPVKDKNYTYYAPTAFSLYDAVSGTTLYYSTTAEKAVLVLKPGSTTTVYEIPYTAYNGRAPYDWSIRLVDGYTGALLGTETRAVPVGGSATYTPQATLTAGETTYTLDPAMQTDYTHTYGDASRVQYLYYNPEGYQPPVSYDLTVQYKNIADGTVLYSTAVAASTMQNTVITSPATYSFGGAEYVRVNGQPDTVAHSFYSPKRTYTVYYRDVNDTAHENTVITVTEVITSESIEETIVYRPGAQTAGGAGTPPAGQTLTIVDNETTGENALLTDDGTDTETAREQIAENEAPLAGGPEQTTNAGEIKRTAAWPLLLGGTALAAALLVILLVWMRRKKRRTNR